MKTVPKLSELFTRLLRSARNPDRVLLEQLVPLRSLAITHANGRTLASHLLGTKAILNAWEQPMAVQLAGVCHSIYSTEHFHHQSLSYQQRPRVRGIIGEKAERLSYLFSAVRRDSLFSAIASLADNGHRPCNLDIVMRPESLEVTGTITLEEAISLLIIHLANIAEQGSGSSAHFFSLARVTELATLYRAFARQLPIAISRLNEEFAVGDEQRLVTCYETGLSLLDEPHEAELSFRDGLELSDALAEPYVLIGYCRLLQGDSTGALLALNEASQRQTEWGTAWDKRLCIGDWVKVVSSLRPVRQQVPKVLAAGEAVRSIARQAMLEKSVSPEALHDKRAGRFLRYLDGIKSDKRLARAYPELRQRNFWDASLFPVCREMENLWQVIRDESLSIEGTHFREEAEDIGRVGKWKVFMLYEGGRRNDSNCLLCPETARIVDQFSSVLRESGLIYFSRLEPGTKIAPHRGSSNIRLRCHLPLVVPQGNCGLRVVNEIRQWKEGECLVFDDFLEHDVWNYTREARLVLLVDLWHPDLSAWERDGLRLMSDLASERAKALFEYWKRNETSKGENDAIEH